MVVFQKAMMMNTNTLPADNHNKNTINIYLRSRKTGADCLN